MPTRGEGPDACSFPFLLFLGFLGTLPVLSICDWLQLQALQGTCGMDGSSNWVSFSFIALIDVLVVCCSFSSSWVGGFWGLIVTHLPVKH